MFVPAICAALSLAASSFSFNGAAMPSGADFALPRLAVPMASATGTIAGRSVNIEVNLYRDFMPSIGRFGGGMFTNVRISSASGRPIPPITSVRVEFTRTGKTSWKPRLSPYATIAYDPASAGYSAGNGPQWAMGSRATARLEIVSGGITYRAQIPVQVLGSF